MHFYLFHMKCTISLRWRFNETPDTYIIINLIVNLMFPINCFYLQKTKVEEMGEVGKRWQFLWEEQLLWLLPSFFSCSSGLGQRKKTTVTKIGPIGSSFSTRFQTFMIWAGLLKLVQLDLLFDPISDIYYI